MKTVKEVLLKMLDVLNKSTHGGAKQCTFCYYEEVEGDIHSYDFEGICILLHDVNINCNLDEIVYRETERFINTNKPRHAGAPYWFTETHVNFKKARVERIKFLEELISYL